MPKIIGGPLTEHREQTRSRLFAALTSLMAEQGFDATTLAEIAARAGVGRTAVYNHVADKESLLLALITHETEAYVEILERALAGLVDPVERLRAYVRQQARLRRVFHLAPGPDLRSVLSPATRAQVRVHAEVIDAVLRGILLDGIAAGAFPDQPLETTVPLIHACLSSRSVPDDGPGREAAIAATEAFVLRAVGVRAPG